MATHRTYSLTIRQLAVSSLSPVITIRVGIVTTQAEALQQRLIALCAHPVMEWFLTNRQGYKYAAGPVNLTRFLYVLRHFCNCHPALQLLPNKLIAVRLKHLCVDNLFAEYHSERTIREVLKNHKRRLPRHIREFITSNC